MSCIFDQTDFVRIHLMQTESTNLSLRQAIDDSLSPEMIGEPDAGAPQLPEYFTITAAYQSAGRGQRGNTWESERGKNLLMSTLLYPRFLPAACQFRLSQAVALAVAEALDQLAPQAGFTLKWPNDIYCGDRKIAGILIEHDLAPQEATLQRSIVGIGINVNQQTFQSDAPNPVSLIDLRGSETPVDTVLRHVATRLKQRYEQLKDTVDAVEDSDPIARDYAQRLYRGDGGLYPFADADGPFQAAISHVTPDGRLHLNLPDGTQRAYWFKEVEYLLES